MENELHFFATTAFQCGYFKDRTATYAVLEQKTKPSIATQTLLLESGFRRSHNTLYLPHCQDCHDCIATRLEVALFKLSKSQRRCLKRNAQWHSEITGPIVTQEIQDLFTRYQEWKHSKGNDDDSSNLDFLNTSWAEIRYILSRDLDGVLIAVTVVDLVENGLSAVYNFYHPDYQHYSLETYAILNEIQYTLDLGLKYLYLGYYLKDTAKMSYKVKYQPLEMYLDRQWVLS